MHRRLIDKVEHDRIRNFEIALHKRPGVSNEDWWDLHLSFSASLKAHPLTVKREHIFVVMDESPERRERKKHLRAVEGAIKEADSSVEVSIEWKKNGFVYVKRQGASSSTPLCSWSWKKAEVVWQTESFATFGLDIDMIKRIYGIELDG